jgi:DNA-directed RNA polymerase subunit RPC12/RpoP
MNREFHIDLTKIEGEGEFLCSTCGKIISPDDETGMTYDILETKTDEDGTLENIIIQCKTCGSITHIKGFEALTETPDLDYLDDYLILPVDLKSI